MWRSSTLCIFLLCLFAASQLAAQTNNDDAAQKATAERFYQLLLKRPQAGTALDKTIEYYQSIGKLDELIQQTKTEAENLRPAQPEAAARHWLTVALIAQSQSRWLESIELLKQAPDTDEQRWSIRVAQSLAYEQLQRWPEVTETLEPMIDQAIDQPEQRSADGVIDTVRRLAKAYSRTGQSKAALRLWRRLENRFRNDQQVAMRLANMAADEGELEFAVEVLDRVLAGMPPSIKRVELAIQRTGLLARSGDEEKAIANYQELLASVNVDSWLADDITRRIEDLIYAKDGVDALLVYYRSELRKQPGNIKVMQRLASILDSERRWQESGEIFQQLINRTSSALEPRMAYAQSLLHQERWHDASVELGKLAQTAPRNEDVLMQWCEAILADTTIDAASRDAQVQKIWDQLAERLPATAASYQSVAARLESLGQHGRVVYWLEKAYRLRSDDFSVVGDYSRALLASGDENNAMEVLSNYRNTLAPRREEMVQLADLYKDIGFAEQATECLIKACDLGATTAMRFRLAEWLESAGQDRQANDQLELAWIELPTQTKVASEQESQCEEIMRRQIKLWLRQAKLTEAIERLSAADLTMPALAGLQSETIKAWRIAKMMAANNQGQQAQQLITQAIEQAPTSPMLWRMKAEIESNAKRLAESVEARQKLAELDVRHRSEYLLQAAKDMARMGNISGALKLTESITTETASSQQVIEVFELALENRATKFAVDLLEKRLQSRPGDVDVLQRLMTHYLDRNAYQLAARLQWQNLELMRTPEQRESAVRLLIDTHEQLNLLDALDQQLQKFWRRHDLWREFGVWQAMIALKRNDYSSAEKQLERLAQSKSTQRFAVEQLLKLARQRNQVLKQFKLLKQLASLDAQAVTNDDLAKVLGQILPAERSRALMEEAMGIVRGPNNRMAVIHILLQDAQADLAMRALEVLPEKEQTSWHMVARSALAWATYPRQDDPAQPHVVHAQKVCEQFIEHSLNLPAALDGQAMLEELFGSPRYIVSFLVDASLNSNLTTGVRSLSSESTNCTSPLRAYMAVLCAQLQAATNSEQRRAILAKHRGAALQQTDLRERSSRLAAQAIVAHFQSKVPAYGNTVQRAVGAGRRMAVDTLELAERARAQLIDSANVPWLSSNASLVERIGLCSEALIYISSDLHDLASQDDPLAAFLCLWEISQQRRELLGSTRDSVWSQIADHYQKSQQYRPFAPAKVLTLLKIVELKELGTNQVQGSKIAESPTLDRKSLREVAELALASHDAAIIDAFVISQGSRSQVADVLGELVSGRFTDSQFTTLDVLKALDCVWKIDVQSGKRSRSDLRLIEGGKSSTWARTLPVCSLMMHNCSLFDQTDFDVLRAVIAQRPSNAHRQEVLVQLQQWSKETVHEDWRLIRQFARIFVLELLEQDAQSTSLLDEVLPESTSSSATQIVLRGLWLDNIGRRDTAIELWLRTHDWPDRLREPAAALLLDWGLERHHDQAINLAVELLKRATEEIKFTSQVAELLKREHLEAAEALLGEFEPAMPMSAEPLATLRKMNIVTTLSPTQFEQLERTDLLSALLRKYSQAGRGQAAERVASRILQAANQSSGDQFIDANSFLLLRIEKGFVDQTELRKFLESQCQVIEQSLTSGKQLSRASLCAMRLAARQHHADLVMPLLKQLGAVAPIELANCKWASDPVVCYVLAQCSLDVEQLEPAAVLMARACQLRSNWLEELVLRPSADRRLVVMVAKELSQLDNIGASIGVEAMNVLLQSLEAGQWKDCLRLFVHWAGNGQAKRAEHITVILKNARRERFDLWLEIVQQLLLAGELHHALLAFEQLNDWQRNDEAGQLEQQLLGCTFVQPQAEQFQAMLEHVIDRTQDNLTARLMLIHGYLSAGKQELASAQLPHVLQDSKANVQIKRWIVEEWEKRSVRVIKPPSGAMAAPFPFPLQLSDIDNAAKAKLLRHLAYRWPQVPDEAGNRARLLERTQELGLIASSQQDDLLKFAILRDQPDKVLEVFDRMLKSHSARAAQPNPLTLGPALIPGRYLNMLAAKQMDWERHLLLVRAAMIENRQIQKSSSYSDQLTSAASSGNQNIKPITYPLAAPAEDLLDRFVKSSRQWLAAVEWRGSPNRSWEVCAKPQLLWDDQQQTIQVESMLDVLWPKGLKVSPECHSRLLDAAKEWSQQLDSFGPWQTLGLHNLAARLQDESLVSRAQQRLIELSANKRKPDDREWRIACWSAVVASSEMPGVADGRFHLAEIARDGALRSDGMKDNFYVAMTLMQLRACGGDQSPIAKDLAELKGLAYGEQAQMNRSFGRWNATLEMVLPHVKVNLYLFNEMVKQEKAVLALSLLDAMREQGWITGCRNGVYIPVASSTRRRAMPPVFDLRLAFQSLMQQKQHGRQLQTLLQELLFDEASVVQRDFEMLTPALDNRSPTVKPEWQDEFDVDQPLPELSLEQTTYGQLIQLASRNQSQAELRQKLAVPSQRNMAHKLVCGVLLAVEDGRLTDAINLYRNAVSAQSNTALFSTDLPMDRADLELMGRAIFNSVKQEPLSKLALQYSQLALTHPLNDASIGLLRKQFALAAQLNRFPELVDVIQSLGGASHEMAQIRDGLRIEYALRLWKAHLILPSLSAYVKSLPETRSRPEVPDRFVIEFMNQVSSLNASDQAALFKCFLSGEMSRFPWLHCFALPVRQPVPDRFRDAATGSGLVHQAIENRQQWVSIMQWLAEYAERNGKQREVVDAATQSSVSDLPASWGAALLAVRLNVPLTAEAFKNRLSPVANSASATDMHALLDCCRQSDELRAVAVELILNRGFPDIALQANRKASQVEEGWKHWLVVSESTPMPASFARGPWALIQDGQWVARPSADTAYLMLRYPIEGDMSFSCNAQQLSGSKFGIGYGGLAMLQSDTKPVVRCIGSGRRQGVSVMPADSLQLPELSIRLLKLGNAWEMQVASARLQEDIGYRVPFVYLANQGTGTARLQQFEFSEQIKIAPRVDLLDSQLRMWRTTFGPLKLPALKTDADSNTTRNLMCQVLEGELHLPSCSSEGMPNSTSTASLHCLRPLQTDETITYECFVAEDTAIVHPTLGRMVLRLNPDHVQLQWLTLAEERQWLNAKDGQLVELAPQEVIAPCKLKLNAWNKVQLKIDRDRNLLLELNGSLIANLALPAEVAPEFGLTVTEPLPSRVRAIELTGPWPKSLSQQEIVERQ